MAYSVEVQLGCQVSVYIRPVDADSAADLLRLLDIAEYYDSEKGKFVRCEISIKRLVSE